MKLRLDKPTVSIRWVKRRRSKTAVPFLCVLLLTQFGCFGPFVQVVELDKTSRAELQTLIPIYEMGKLRQSTYDRLGTVEATSCQNKIWDPLASRDDALIQLRYKARIQGANAVTEVACGDQAGTSLLKNCWTSVTCHGVAAKLQAIPNP